MTLDEFLNKIKTIIPSSYQFISGKTANRVIGHDDCLNFIVYIDREFKNIYYPLEYSMYPTVNKFKVVKYKKTKINDIILPTIFKSVGKANLYLKKIQANQKKQDISKDFA